MKYFNSLPIINVTDKFGNTKSYRNIMARVAVIPEILNNPLVYYTYDIQEGDTPEIVAEKYYGDSYRYWIVLFSNQLMDPQWDWPLNSTQFNNYVTDKYSSLNIDPTTTIKSYQKVITQTSLQTGNVTVNKVEITQDEYDSFVNYYETLTLPTESLSVSIEKAIQTYYDYEIEMNESKKSIKLLNKNYVGQIEKEFQALVNNK